LESKYIGCNPGVSILFFFNFHVLYLTHTNLNSEVTHLLFNYMFQKLSVLDTDIILIFL
jgi:hypothetical protein